MNAFAWRLRGLFSFLLFGGVCAGYVAAADTGGTAAKQRQADDAVREALQREAYGLDEDRAQLLAAALKADPDNPAARWHQGYIKSPTGEWVPADDLSDAKRLASLRLYDKIRDTYENTVSGQLALADWCAKQGLKEQERVHLLRVCELSPDHPSARQRLNFARVGNDWVPRDELMRTQARDLATQKALAQWSATITKIASQLTSTDVKKREAAVDQLKQIRDPAAIPALNAIIASRDENLEMLVLDVTSQMTGPTVAAAIARHAVFSPSIAVRQKAAEKLRACELDHYVPLLISSMYTPVISRMATVALPNGRIGYRHEFLREGSDRRELLVLDTVYRSRGGPGTEVLAAAEAAATARQLEQAAEWQNQATAKLNDRIAWALKTATGVDLPAQPDEWWTWWNNLNEVFVEGSKPLYVAHQSRQVNVATAIPTGGGTHDCLAAGTPVWTALGEVPIEKIRPGDLVLSRDVETGELAYKPVLRTTVRPTSPLVKIQAGKESFETSGGHLFWVSGEGWKRSRQLETGMVLHTASGPVRVTYVGEGANAPTYNLVVADFNTYFVGKQKLLSHDNTVRQPTSTVVPGLKAD
jgi:hypothetical protein